MRWRGAAIALWLGLAGLPLTAQELPPPDTPAPDALSIDPPARPPLPRANLPARTIETPREGGAEVVAPVLTVDQDALFTGSAWGRRVQAQLDAQGRRVSAENERLADQLAAEEAELTERRPEMEPAEFRQEAEAFDLRATQIRRERAQVVQELNAQAEADRTAFYQAALPVMGDLMASRGAVAVLDRRTVFVSLDAIDITDDLIALLDETLSDGAGRPGTLGGPEP